MTHSFKKRRKKNNFSQGVVHKLRLQILPIIDHLLKYLPLFTLVDIWTTTYSSVPNRRIGPNKRAGGKILKKH